MQRTGSPRMAVMVMGLALIGVISRPAHAASTPVAIDHLGEVDPGAVAGNTGNSTTVDSSATHDDLTRFGSPTYSSDTPGGSSTLSMSLNGTTDYYETTTVPTTANTDFIAEIWVKAAAIQGSAVVMSSGTSGAAHTWSIWENGGHWNILFEGSLQTGNADNATAVSTDTWTQLALVVDTSTTTLYINGTAEVTANQVPVSPNAFFSIGSENGGAKFDGLVDEARILTYTGTFDPSDLNNLTFTVPEPASVGLLAVGASLMLSRRRGVVRA